MSTSHIVNATQTSPPDRRHVGGSAVTFTRYYGQCARSDRTADWAATRGAGFVVNVVGAR